MKKKITLIGAGQIGGTLAHLIALKELADVVLVDIADGITKGKALDLSQSSTIELFDLNITGSKNFKNLKISNIPNLEDINSMIKLLKSFGVSVVKKENEVILNAKNLKKHQKIHQNKSTPKK